MKTPEHKLKDDVRKFLVSLPKCWYFMPVPTGYGIRGIPDFVGCYKGKFFGIETKAPGGKSKAWQELVLSKIVAAGGIAVVSDNMDEISAVFREA